MNKYDIFMQWLQENGAILSDVYLENLSNSERGIKN